MDVKREEDNTFKCKCGKGFNYPDSLCKHVKGCNSKLMEPEEDRSEGVSMNIDDNDASESMDLDCRVIRDNCFGHLISHEDY